MGFFGSGDKNQSTTNVQTGVSEDGLLVQGGAAAKDDSTVLQASGLGSVVKVGTSEITGNSGTINFGLPQADVKNLLNGVTDNIGSIVTSQSAAAASQLETTLAGLSDLALSKQTDGGSNLAQLALWLGLGLLALGAFVAWAWSKRK